MSARAAERIAREAPIGNGLHGFKVTSEPVTRCRDCIRAAEMDGGLVCGLRKAAGYFRVEPDDFCSRAISAVECGGGHGAA